MINQLQLANTFNEWRITTNDLIGISNDLKEGNLQTTGTITIDNLNGYQNNIGLNVSSGMIWGDGGMLSNTGSVGSIKNDRLQNNSIIINSNNPQVALSSNTVNLGQAVFLNVTNLATRVNDTSTANIASANAVNAVHVVATFANSIGNYSISRVNAVSDTVNSAYVLANTSAATLNTTGNTLTNTTFTAIAAYNFANTRFSANGGTINGSVAISGDLIVTGNASFVDTYVLNVSDPIIYIASNNYVYDLVDIGFVANYVNTTGQNVHTGMIRDATTKEWYVFQGYDKEPFNNHIDTTANGFSLAMLNANLRTSNIILSGLNVTTWIASAYNTANIAIANTNFVNAEASAAFATANIAIANVDYVNVATVAAFTKANAALANTTGTFAGNLTVAGVITDRRGADIRTRPITTPGGAYVLSRGDLGNTISITTTTYLPNATFTSGDMLTIFNNSNIPVTLVPNSSVVLYRSNSNNDVTSTSRNLNAYAIATIYCVAANTFVIDGTAVTV